MKKGRQLPPLLSRDLRRGLSKRLANRFTERRLIAGAELTELTELAKDQRLLECRENRLDGGGLEEAGCLPLPDPNVAWSGLARS
jgi:hypothetical protein